MNTQNPATTFRDKVQALDDAHFANTGKHDWDGCWQKAIRENRALYNEMMNSDAAKRQTAFLNEAGIASCEEARESIVHMTLDRQFHNRELSFLSALRSVCSINPGKARAAGFANDAAIVDFANAQTQSGASDGRTGAYSADPGEEQRKRQQAAQNMADGSRNVNGAPADYTDYWLPFDCTQDEYDTAKSAGTTPQKILDGLAKRVAKDRGIGLDVAYVYCAGRFPKLFAAGAKAPGITVRSSQGTSSAA